MKNIKDDKMVLKGSVLECIVEGKFDSAIQFLHKFNDKIFDSNEISFNDRFFYYYHVIRCYISLDKHDMALDYFKILDFIISTNYKFIEENYEIEIMMFNELKEFMIREQFVNIAK